MKIQLSISILLLICSIQIGAQSTGIIKGTLYNQFEEPVVDANIVLTGTSKGTVTDKNGKFTIKVPANEKITIKYSSAQYWNKKSSYTLFADETKEVRVTMNSRTFSEHIVTFKDPGTGAIGYFKPIPPSEITGIGENIEQTLKFGNFGVSQNNELSAGYNVRGGNFNENLIYVNDIQVYRPFLARSGQQEGLSFINPYMVSDILFSAGGFDAKYGDKLSSVLDITYSEATTPNEFKGTFTSSLLGAAAHVEQNASSRFNYITGIRYRTNSYLLGALDTKGEYKPIFVDYQGMFNFLLTEKTKLSIFGTYSKNKFRVVPESRETNFGSINEALRFTVFYEGQEITQFETYMAAASLTHKQNDLLTLKFISSIYQTHETESFDLLGEYKLDELERDLGNDDLGEVAFNRGVGAFLNHARNELNATVANAYHKGTFKSGKHKFQWGAKYQHEIINDKISEWNQVDSSRFNIPHPQDSVGYIDPTAQPYQYLRLSSVVKSKNDLQSNRLSGYIQDMYRIAIPKTIYFEDSVRTKDSAYIIKDTIETSSYFSMTGGVRANYWDYNNQLVISPRISFNFRPAWFYVREDEIYRRNVSFRFATGFYYQPPFYRETRNLQGVINPEIRAQKSIHFVLGSDYTFFMWKRPFKFGAETYYKHLTDIIPYEIDNVRIRYYGENNAKGYATGIDLKINGEFVKGIESYASLSYMKTQEDILDDYFYEYYNSDGEEIITGYTANDIATDSIRIEPGYIPRPSDQRVSFALFFQDRMPEEWNTEKVKWSTFKVNLTVVFGTALPYGPPGKDRYKDTLRSSLYKRVDIGFSKELLTDKTKYKEGSLWKKIDKMWLSFEVFNLLDISNTINYNWVKDVSGRQYAIPSFLTSRRLNLKLVAQF